MAPARALSSCKRLTPYACTASCRGLDCWRKSAVKMVQIFKQENRCPGQSQPRATEGKVVLLPCAAARGVISPEPGAHRWAVLKPTGGVGRGTDAKW